MATTSKGLFGSSLARKYWMAATGLFLCTFLVGHLLGNLQLIFINGEEGRQAFNEYALFMTTFPVIRVLSILTMVSIILHVISFSLWPIGPFPISQSQGRPPSSFQRIRHRNV